jgi:hypothetical protein
MIMYKKRILLLVPIIAVSLFFSATAFAQTDSTAACGTDALEKLFCSTNISDMLNQVFQLSITLGGVLAMLRIGYAGWLYMGREDMWSTKQHAKEVFRDAIIGLLVLLAIYMILFQINPCILKLQLFSTPGTACSPQSEYSAQK